MLPALPPVFSTPPILMYHRVDAQVPRDPVGRDLTVTPRQFEAQLRALRAHGLAAVSMAQLERRLRLREPLDRIVVLTFDDGYADQYAFAVPLLREYGGSATFYIVSGEVGRPRHVTWPQLRAMRAQGFDIAAHGVQHDDLSLMSPAAQRYEIETSIAALRRHAHAPVGSYAYPSGRFNAQTLLAVARSGVAFALTTDPAYVVPPETRFEMTRVRVRGEWDSGAFWNGVEAAWRSPHIVRR
ncbi:MAG: polysaccharide deacetylase family protein [Candidatus Baltobacteraceae bacterium]